MNPSRMPMVSIRSMPDSRAGVALDTEDATYVLPAAVAGALGRLLMAAGGIAKEINDQVSADMVSMQREKAWSNA
jgi:hypothetical protein